MRIVVFLAVLLVPSALAQGLEDRVLALEARVAQLEAAQETPAPPAAATEVDGFAFTRLALDEPLEGYTSIVGEVVSGTEFESVQFRVTAYAADGSIVGTKTFYVDSVGPSPRTFDTTLSDTPFSDVASIGWQVESAR